MKRLHNRPDPISQSLAESLHPIFAGIATVVASESIKSLSLQNQVKHASSLTHALHSTFMSSADRIRFTLSRAG